MSQVKYPLDCGCKGPHWAQFCPTHAAEDETDRGRLMGIPDLRLTHRDFTDLPSLVKTLHTIKLQLISNPTKSLLIKIIPEYNNETDASSEG